MLRFPHHPNQNLINIDNAASKPLNELFGRGGEGEGAFHFHLCHQLFALPSQSLTQQICDQGNLGWAYMQQGNHVAAEVVYRKAQIVDPDANKACNLCLCLIKQTRYVEAQSVLDDVLQGALSGSDEPKSKIRAKELLQELEQCQTVVLSSNSLSLNIEDAFLEGLDHLMKHWTPLRSRRLPIFEEISSFRDQLACWFCREFVDTSPPLFFYVCINSIGKYNHLTICSLCPSGYLVHFLYFFLLLMKFVSNQKNEEKSTFNKRVIKGILVVATEWNLLSAVNKWVKPKTTSWNVSILKWML